MRVSSLLDSLLNDSQFFSSFFLFIFFFFFVFLHFFTLMLMVVAHLKKGLNVFLYGFQHLFFFFLFLFSSSSLWCFIGYSLALFLCCMCRRLSGCYEIILKFQHFPKVLSVFEHIFSQDKNLKRWGNLKESLTGIINVIFQRIFCWNVFQLKKIYFSESHLRKNW